MANWSQPKDDHPGKKYLAENKFEPHPFYVQWNPSYKCWGAYECPHILVACSKVFKIGNEVK